MNIITVPLNLSPQINAVNGLDKAILENRKDVIEQAKKQNPERWNGRDTRDLTLINTVYLNPGKPTKKEKKTTEEKQFR